MQHHDRVSTVQISRMNQRQLLSTRFCQLDITVEHTPIQKYVERLYREIDAAGMHGFRPKVYFGDEWFCPDGSTLISVPFYLAHRNLKKLEASITGQVEGEHPRDLMRLLRHETGHCFNHAFQLNKTREWRELFGSPKKLYAVENYPADPHSKHFVRHLSGFYAQSHPDEDFAESFAVWLSPWSQWRRRYAHWPKALKKLHYVDRMVENLKLEFDRIPKSRPLSHVRQLRSTLGRYYKKRVTRCTL
jgi:hypothetical protein